MLEQVSNAITFYAFYVATKVGKTGLTVTVDVYRNGTEIVTAGSATERGDGLYSYALSSGSVDAEGVYIAVFKTADTSVDQQHLAAAYLIGTAGIEYLDAAMTSRTTAAQVRTELSTELGRIDATISSRATGASVAALNDVTAAEVAAALAGTVSLTLVSVVNGSDIRVYALDDWTFTWGNSGLTLGDYDVLAFVVKAGEEVADEDGLLYVRDDLDVVAVNGVEPLDPTVGSLTSTETSFTVALDSEMTDLPASYYRWWLKGLGPEMTLATGSFEVAKAGIRAVE